MDTWSELALCTFGGVVSSSLLAYGGYKFVTNPSIEYALTTTCGYQGLKLFMNGNNNSNLLLDFYIMYASGGALLGIMYGANRIRF